MNPFRMLHELCKHHSTSDVSGLKCIRSPDGISIELLQESDIEAYAAEMSQWVDYANSELSHCEKSPAAVAFREAQRRALEIENRLRR